MAEGSIIDRFSNLPDEVAHHILSFLTITDVTRAGSVSKKCRNLRLSLPSLNFDGIPFANFPMPKRAKLLSSLGRFLITRGDHKIQSFRFRWKLSRYNVSSLHDEIYRLVTWICNAVKCNVEVLHLEFIFRSSVWSSRVIELPSCVFLCPSLRSFSLNLHKSVLQLPSLVSCNNNLRYLKLKQAVINEVFLHWISSSCKCIKELSLEECDGIKIVTIENPSLEIFSFKSSYGSGYAICHLNISGQKLEDINIEWEFNGCPYSSSSSSLTIFAPNVKSFKWSGNLMKHINLGNFMYLKEAEIFLKPKEDEYDKLFEILCSVCMVEVLILNDDTTKALFRESCLPLPLGDICYLGLRIRSLKDELVLPTASLLRGMTSLKTLSIKSDPSSSSKMEKADNASGFDMGYWKSQKLAFGAQLTDVTVQLSKGNNELELARYILEHAHNLKKMVILYSEKFNDARRKIKRSNISTAKVVFLKKQRRWKR